jgi:hypothetical protein
MMTQLVSYLTRDERTEDETDNLLSHGGEGTEDEVAGFLLTRVC